MEEAAQSSWMKMDLRLAILHALALLIIPVKSASGRLAKARLIRAMGRLVSWTEAPLVAFVKLRMSELSATKLFVPRIHAAITELVALRKEWTTNASARKATAGSTVSTMRVRAVPA